MAFPSTYNFDYYRGDTLEFVVRPKSGNSTFQLDGYEAIFTIATERGSGGTQYDCVATINTTTDVITCTITSAVGRGIPAGSYVYDVQITDPEPNPEIIYTLLTGTITVTDDITGAV